MSTATVITFTREEAEAKRNAILEQVRDPDEFRRRGENYELDPSDRLLYDDLRELDYLLGE
ncbi:hypothetical protein [Brevibacterium samyangense]|uniref:Uncharacterized protein n=1 Tax=Brevibacterium samyangense TaxID=366888 RepID=A0ABN2TBE4_9MICO